MLNDLSVTRLEIEDEIGIFRHNLIAEVYYDKDSGKYMVRIPSMTAKYHIFNWGIQIPQKINREIILIPDKLSKLKALVSFILSNKALKNGVSFNSVCDKLDILDSPNRSRFKRQIRENRELLNKFNIKYDEERKIFYYENIREINFKKALNSKDIDILKRDFLNRPFKQNIQSSMGGFEEAVFEILEFKPTDDEKRFIAVIKRADGTIFDSTTPIDRKLLLGLK
jgi:hypothetical protein